MPDLTFAIEGVQAVAFRGGAAAGVLAAGRELTG